MSKTIIISGGGTGGHIFPAVSIAQEIKRREPETHVEFVGAVGGMELEVVPRYGFSIQSVWISGIQRQLTLRNIGRNLLFPLKLIVSLVQARKIVRQQRPQFVVGVGGFASGPLGRAAASKGIPLFLCEQNAYPGLVNRWLAGKARKILLGNEDAQKYFEAGKTVVTGNPIRPFTLPDQQAARKALGLDPDRPTILSLGGSLGALRLNQAWQAHQQAVQESGVQVIWQCGKRYAERLQAEVAPHPRLQVKAFIEDMAQAYAAADLIVSRAGGSTISELIALSKPSILVPSPNVAEDHQTKNARSLSEKGAALLVKDAEAVEKLVPLAVATVQDATQMQTLQQGIDSMEKHDAAKEIVDEILKSL